MGALFFGALVGVPHRALRTRHAPVRCRRGRAGLDVGEGVHVYG
jgi:hypothetical protein